MTLGDSYSSGTGIHSFVFGYDEFFGATAKLDLNDSEIEYEFKFTGTSPACCLRETDTTSGLDFEMGACSGAKIQHPYDQIDYLNARYPQEYDNQWRGSTTSGYGVY